MELRQLGLNKEADILFGQQRNKQYFVWPENWEAWEVFTALSDQWIFTPFGGAIALNGSTVIDYVRLLGMDAQTAKQLYNDVRHIATGALTAWREKSKAGDK